MCTEISCYHALGSIQSTLLPVHSILNEGTSHILREIICNWIDKYAVQRQRPQTVDMSFTSAPSGDRCEEMLCKDDVLRDGVLRLSISWLSFTSIACRNIYYDLWEWLWRAWMRWWWRCEWVARMTTSLEWARPFGRDAACGIALVVSIAATFCLMTGEYCRQIRFGLCRNHCALSSFSNSTHGYAFHNFSSLYLSLSDWPIVSDFLHVHWMAATFGHNR